MRVGREGSQGLQGGVKGAGTARGWNVTGFHVHHVACSTGAMIGDQGGEVLGSGQAVCQRGMVDQGDDPVVSHAPPPPRFLPPGHLGGAVVGAAYYFFRRGRF
jgi:hypothetical protein